MRARTTADQLERDALEALVGAGAALSLEIGRPRSENGGSDLVLTLPGRENIVLEVKAVSIPTVEQVRALAERATGRAISVLVADQIPAAIRTMLNDAAIGWLDRRGHLRLTGDGIHVDADIPRLSRKAPHRGIERDPIKGRSGLAAAAALLLRPDDPIGVSAIARIARLNPSSITRAMTALADAQLAERHGRGQYRALVPELFWALADAWPRDSVTLRWATPPERDDRLLLRNDDLEMPGWVAAGVPGAVAWGAPLAATADFPVHLYAPDQRLVREATLLHEGGAGNEAMLSVDPIGLITHGRYHAGSLTWAVAHPLFCALDLTISSRDREALEQWTPPEGFARVW